jgi:hypothetical protein
VQRSLQKILTSLGAWNIVRPFSSSYLAWVPHEGAKESHPRSDNFVPKASLVVESNQCPSLAKARSFFEIAIQLEKRSRNKKSSLTLQD